MSNTYNIMIFENTGFNAVNIPLDKKTVVDSASNQTTVRELFITQPRFLSTINVPVEWSQVNNCDYCIIWANTEGTTYEDGWCYFVMGVTMQAEDVATLTIVPDYLTSAGGVSSVNYIDGMVTRSTYALNHVDPNKLEGSDPYLAPAETMELKTEWMGDGNQGVTFIDSTYDITATCYENDAYTAVNTLSTKDVTYPVPVYADETKEVKYTLDSNTFSGVGTNAIIMDSNLVQSAYLASAKIGLAKLRGMGLESGVLHQVFIPSKYVTPTIVTAGSESQQYKYYVTNMTGNWTNQSTTIAMNQYGNSDRESQVLNYSEFSKYGLMSASGESLEADPKDLMTTSNPVIISVGDPRPEGKPYFRFEKLNNTTVSHQDFFRSCISGLPWKNVPLVYTQASGSMLNTARFSASRRAADLGLNQANRAYGLQKEFANQNYEQGKAFQILDILGGAIDTSIGYLSSGGGVENLSLPSVSNVYRQIMNVIGRDNAYSQNISSIANAQVTTSENYAIMKLQDTLNYDIAQNVVLPTVTFPYNTEIVRDFYGNGVLVYRYCYTAKDQARIKRILRAYGVKYTTMIEQNYMVPEEGKEYCYVEANGISVADKPQWMANGIAMQLANGVRVWNTRPHAIA